MRNHGRNQGLPTRDDLDRHEKRLSASFFFS